MVNDVYIASNEGKVLDSSEVLLNLLKHRNWHRNYQMTERQT